LRKQMKQLPWLKNRLPVSGRLSLACLVLAGLWGLVWPAWAQSAERQELRLRVRTIGGLPVAHMEVALVRTADQAPMGSRTTNAAGEAVWLVAPALEYEFLLPEEIWLDENTRNQLGDMGLGGFGVIAGPANSDQSLPPILVGIVLADETAVTGGDFAFMDAEPEGSPRPVLIPDGHGQVGEDGVGAAGVDAPVQEGFEAGGSFIFELPDAGTDEAAAELTAVDAARNGSGRWGLWGLLLLVLAGGVVVWLYPTLRTLWPQHADAVVPPSGRWGRDELGN
jgi:hypothetical protein